MKTPVIDPSVFVAPTATVMGHVSVAAGSSIFFGAVVRAEEALISIGENTNIQDVCVLHTDPGMPMTIGNGVTVGHGAILHSCTVRDNTLIGMGAIVLNGAVVGRDCIVGAGALVPSGMVINRSPLKSLSVRSLLRKHSASLLAASIMVSRIKSDRSSSW